MQEKFNIDYVIGDNTVNLKIGQEVYYIETKYVDEYKYCLECHQGHSIGKKYTYQIIPATIFGFIINDNHCFSYNTKNPFTLKVIVIDENDNEKTFSIGEFYFNEKEAQEKIDNRISNSL